MDELRRLESMRFASPALSLYLPLRGEQAEAGFVKRWLRHLARPGAAQEAATDEELQRELDRVEARIRALDSKAPAVAAFSSVAARLLEVFELPEPVEPVLVFGRRLETGPLRALVERRPPVLAAVVDKERGWLFEVWLAQVSELARFSGMPVHHHRQGQTLSTTLQRRADQQAERNLRPLARAIERGLERGHFATRVIVAGPAEARSALVHELSSRARGAVELEASVPAYLTPGEMRRRVLEVAGQVPPSGG